MGLNKYTRTTSRCTYGAPVVRSWAWSWVERVAARTQFLGLLLIYACGWSQSYPCELLGAAAAPCLFSLSGVWYRFCFRFAAIFDIAYFLSTRICCQPSFKSSRAQFNTIQVTRVPYNEFSRASYNPLILRALRIFGRETSYLAVLVSQELGESHHRARQGGRSDVLHSKNGGGGCKHFSGRCLHVVWLLSFNSQPTRRKKRYKYSQGQPLDCVSFCSPAPERW